MDLNCFSIKTKYFLLRSSQSLSILNQYSVREKPGAVPALTDSYHPTPLSFLSLNFQIYFRVFKNLNRVISSRVLL